MTEKIRIGIVGRCKAGSALKLGLKRAGYSPAIAGRERGSIENLSGSGTRAL